MAHFAELDENNMVLRVIVVNNDDIGNLEFPESEPVGIEFCQSIFGQHTIWKQTSYNRNFRGVYAGIGYIYVPNLDIFRWSEIPASWILNTETGKWDAPIPKPEVPDGYVAIWDDIAQEWDVILDRTT
jgi:hypothetical protein